MLLALALPCTASLSHEHLPSQPHALQKEVPYQLWGNNVSVQASREWKKPSITPTGAMP